jgi:hypothetical protein
MPCWISSSATRPTRKGPADFDSLLAVGQQRLVSSPMAPNMLQLLQAELRTWHDWTCRRASARTRRATGGAVRVTLVPPAGFEPATSRSGGARSNPLSYEGTEGLRL